ncbi:MAG TPA: hypothetical protein VF824_06455 [Thermoanaerobaculia bacterium]|jgi:hypothetical protein
MRRFFVFFVFLFLPLIAAAEEAPPYNRTFNVGTQGGTVTLQADRGSVTVVKGTSNNTLLLSVTRSAFGTNAAEVLAGSQINATQSGSNVSVTGKTTVKPALGTIFNVNFTITVPPVYNVNLTTGSGSVTVSNVGGSAAINRGGGSVQVTSVSGNVQISGSGGATSVSSVGGSLILSTKGGSLTANSIGGSVSGTSSGGSATLNDVGPANLTNSGGSMTVTFVRQPATASSLANSGGSMTVAIANTLHFTLDAVNTGGGSVSSSVPVTGGTKTANSLTGNINGGGPALTLRGSGGSITIKPR